MLIAFYELCYTVSILGSFTRFKPGNERQTQVIEWVLHKGRVSGSDVFGYLEVVRMPDPGAVNPASNTAQSHFRSLKSTNQILDCARTLAAKNSQSLTPIREHVLKTLLEAGRPMTAYEVVQRLGGIGAMNAPTAYRALDFLEALGLIRKITSLRKYVVLRSGPTHEPLVFGICEACGAVQEIEDTASLNSLVANAQTVGFATRLLTVELTGLCKAAACSVSDPSV